MSRGPVLLLLLACALIGAPAAVAGGPLVRPPLTFVRGGGSYTEAARTPKSHRITTIVIHATDGGSMLGNVWWLSGGHSHASAHYVISREGSIVQLVHLSDIAWHAGNWKVNQHSIGVEHVGETYDPAGFATEQYRSSARLVAWLVRRYDIPVDRQHIIGHSQVTDPNHPGEHGGSGHHTDPGPFWRWGYYLNLVRHDAFPQRYRLHVHTTTIDGGQALQGIVPWSVRTRGPAARRVEFAIDGHVVWIDRRRPFSFAAGRGWNTTAIENGRHVLTVRATGAAGAATQRLVVNVVNHDFALTTSALRPWQKVKGTLRVRANVRGAKSSGIGLYIDGRAISRDGVAPYTLRWNSRKVSDGRHWLTLAAVATDGRSARRRLPLVVANHPRPKKKPVHKPKPRPRPIHPKPKPAPKPKPKPKPIPPKPLPAPQITRENLVDGQTVTGIVDWQAHTIGAVARVEFAVDGVIVSTGTTEPWRAAWDSGTVAPGPHALEVRAYTKDGRKAVRPLTVTVTPPISTTPISTTPTSTTPAPPTPTTASSTAPSGP
ncbi:MAG: N-acetylmuramoyl-L-alanine amidase [Gaiellaceae bacterium]